jgi:prepilin-type N-terminal cleavage/methylation domain-containing protein
MKWISRRARAARHGSDDAAGFTLIEVIVALGLILFVMTGSVTFFVRSLQTSSTQQVREAAVALADADMEQARALTASGMLVNRDATRATAQWSALPAAAQSATSLSTVAYDPNPTSTTPNLAFSTSDSTTLVNNLQYTVNTAIGSCYLAVTTSAVCSSANQGTTGATLMYRVIVDVHWSPKVGENCPASGCDYVVTTLRDAQALGEPLFNSNNVVPTATATS